MATQGSPGSAPGQAPQVWSLTRDFTDADDLVEALNGVDLEYVPLRAGPYASRLTLVGLGGCVVQRASDPPHVARGPITPGTFGLLCALDVGAPAEINGAPLDRGEALLMRPGFEMHALAKTDSDWVSLMLPAAMAEPLLDLAGLGAGAPMLRLPAATVRSLQRLLRGVTDEARAGGALPAVLGAAFGDHLAEAFTRAAPPQAPPRRTRRALSVFRMVEEFLVAQGTQPLHLEDIVAATGTSPRSLHQVFLATTGMSPAAYLRRRRLMQVHAVLKRADPARTLVKTVALDHGFWHLGHFAEAYGAMFGCQPQETLRRRPSETAPVPEFETEFSDAG